MKKRSKLYRSRCEGLDRSKNYSFEEGIKLLQAMPKAKFDETVEVAFTLGIDPKQSDQIVRGALVMPRGTGKTQRVVVVADGEAAEAAKAAGADEVGHQELLQKMKGGNIRIVQITTSFSNESICIIYMLMFFAISLFVQTMDYPEKI